MNSGISLSRRSAASLIVSLTRAEAPSTLRLKSFMVLLVLYGREQAHANCGLPGEIYYFLPGMPWSMAPVIGKDSERWNAVEIECGLPDEVHRENPTQRYRARVSQESAGLVRRPRP